MIGPGAAAERVLREQAIAEATELFAHHGDAAADLLTAKIHDQALSAPERRRYRLARVEVERLGRERRQSYHPHSLAVWRPPLLSWAGLAALFGFSRKRPVGRRRR